MCICVYRETFTSFSAEEIEILNRHRPDTIHAASQLQGITPHTIIYLYNFLTRKKHYGLRKTSNTTTTTTTTISELGVE